MTHCFDAEICFSSKQLPGWCREEVELLQRVLCALDLLLFCPASSMGVALHLQCHCLGDTESLLFAALEPAFYSQPCTLSPKLLWQHFPEHLKQWFSLVGLMLLSFFMLFLWLCTCKPRYCYDGFSQETTTAGMRPTPFFPSFLPLIL